MGKKAFLAFLKLLNSNIVNLEVLTDVCFGYFYRKMNKNC